MQAGSLPRPPSRTALPNYGWLRLALLLLALLALLTFLALLAVQQLHELGTHGGGKWVSGGSK